MRRGYPGRRNAFKFTLVRAGGWSMKLQQLHRPTTLLKPDILAGFFLEGRPE